jgi:type IV secretion system protein TrbE
MSRTNPLLYNPRGGARERAENDRVGKLLRAWSRDGEKGKLLDGVSNIRLDGRVAHFELGQIPEHATEMRAATNFLVANYGTRKIIAMPRAVPKVAIFEEAARTLEIPGGVRMIQEYKYAYVVIYSGLDTYVEYCAHDGN